MHRWGFAGDDNPAQELGLRIIGQAVRAGRLDFGTSQRQLAFRVGLSQSTLSRLETGRLRNMRMVTLARVIGAVNMPSRYLVPGEPPPPTRRLPGQDTGLANDVE